MMEMYSCQVLPMIVMIIAMVIAAAYEFRILNNAKHPRLTKTEKKYMLGAMAYCIYDASHIYTDKQWRNGLISASRKMGIKF